MRKIGRGWRMPVEVKIRQENEARYPFGKL
jgi:hypothetical protein